MSETDPPFDEPVVLHFDDVLDLHPFKPKDIPSVVEEFIEECRRAAILEVRLIHGKGAGIQRAIVRSLLDKHPAVISFKDAPAEAGGWGATIVSLLGK
jgi:DNA-nicking Smr family endonuclease